MRKRREAQRKRELNAIIERLWWERKAKFASARPYWEAEVAAARRN